MFHSLGTKGNDETTTYPGWGLERPWLTLPCARRKDDFNVAPFLTTRLAACTYLLLNVMRFKRFLSHLILTLSWCLKKRIRSQSEKFAPSYNPFFRIVQNTILTTVRIARTLHVSHPSTEAKHCPRFGIDASRPLSNVIPKRANPLAVVEGVPSRFFHSSVAAEAIRYVCQACFQSPVSKGQHIPSEPSDEREFKLFKKLNLVPNSIRSVSHPTTSWVAPRVDLKRHPILGPDTVPFEAEKCLWTKKAYEGPYDTRLKICISPFGLRQFSALGFDARLVKATSTLCIHIDCSIKDRLRKANLSVSQWLSRLGIPKLPLWGRS